MHSHYHHYYQWILHTVFPIKLDQRLIWCFECYMTIDFSSRIDPKKIYMKHRCFMVEIHGYQSNNMQEYFLGNITKSKYAQSV